MSSFKSYALSEKMLEALTKLGYKVPTKIQRVVIPCALKGESLLATSETGSGKTHAFLIPIIENIDFNKDEIQAIIFSPTRELAAQTYAFIREFSEFFPLLRARLLSSGEDKNRTIGKLKTTPHIIIATPGRLHDLSFNEGALNAMSAKYVVLDEADMLTELGFLNTIDDIVARLKDPSIYVFSATIKENFIPFLAKYVKPEHRFLLAQKDSNPNRVKHFAVDTKHQDEIDCLIDFIKAINSYMCLVFASTKAKVDQVYNALISKNLKVGVLHGDLTSRERKQMMKRILNHDFQIVVCSDMAARGLDINGVSDIINLDLPKDLSFYFHRAGRTGRYDQVGNCYTFYDQDSVDRVTRLLTAGVKLSYLSFKNGLIKEESTMATKKAKRKKVDTELEKEIRIAVSKTKTTKVKPGYKKKVRDAVEKAKKRHKRKIIREDIRRQRVERYKKEAKRGGNNG